MNYQSQPDQTRRTSVSYSHIYICLRFDEIQFRGHLVIAYYMDLNQFKGCNS